MSVFFFITFTDEIHAYEWKALRLKYINVEISHKKHWLSAEMTKGKYQPLHCNLS